METGRESTWWDKNWAWVVSAGCLVPVVLVAGVVTLGMFAVRRTIEPYELAVEQATENPALRQALGEPVEHSWKNLSIDFDATEGRATVEFTVTGPDGNAEVLAVARKQEDRWVFIEMTAEVEGGEEIDLLAAGGGPSTGGDE